MKRNCSYMESHVSARHQSLANDCLNGVFLSLTWLSALLVKILNTENLVHNVPIPSSQVNQNMPTQTGIVLDNALRQSCCKVFLTWIICAAHCCYPITPCNVLILIAWQLDVSCIHRKIMDRLGAYCQHTSSLQYSLHYCYIIHI